MYREIYSIPNKPVESAKKLVRDTLPSGFDIHIQISQNNLNKFEEEKSQVLFKARQVAVKAQDLRKSGADWNLQKQHIQ